MKKYISKFHYITRDLPGIAPIEQVQIACEAGANWIMYQGLSKGDDELLEELHPVASICDDWGATLIVADHLHLLDKADIQGVHLDEVDADFLSVRNQISDEKTLGASASSLADIVKLAATGVVDYIYFYPADIGMYGEIVDQIRNLSIHTPVLAADGITIMNITEIVSTGVYGIAVSPEINVPGDFGNVIKEMYRNVY